MKKILLSILVLVLLLIPVVSSADVIGADSQIPALNPFCWPKKDCVEQRKKYLINNPSDTELAEDGFVTGPSVAPCVGGAGDSEWGRCLPAGVTHTEIDFGGKSDFANVGVFILWMYKYLVGTAAILAVIMIIVAGIQWITSGGNSEAISSAKHRIGGAIIGLFIAYLSYFILNTINPNLVNFRLPQVWLVRPQSLIPEFCRDVPGAQKGEIKFFYYADSNDQTSPVDFTKADQTSELTYGKQNKPNSSQPLFYCGNRFAIVQGGSRQACFGSLCPSSPGNRQVCVNSKGIKSCVNGDLAIHLSIRVDAFDIEEQIKETVGKANWEIFVTKLMETDWIYRNKGTNHVYGVCKRTSKGNDMLFLANRGDSHVWDSIFGGEEWMFGPDGPGSSYVSKKSTPYYEYDLYFINLADPSGVQWDCLDGQLVGYFILIETDANESAWDKYTKGVEFFSWDYINPLKGGAPVRLLRNGAAFVSNLWSDGPQPNLTIGYDRKTGQPVFGTFINDIGDLNNYIPLDKLQDEGLYFDLQLTIPKLIRMKGRSADSPDDYALSIFGWPVSK